VPVFFDGTESNLLGYMRDLSPSGIFLQTTAGIDVGMRCALNFPLPGHDGRVHVVGRVVRTVPPQFSDETDDLRIPGLGVEFERFGDATDRRAIDSFLHGREGTSRRPETGILSVDG
jgi:Tfp pilus assembly protein PilZ